MDNVRTAWVSNSEGNRYTCTIGRYELSIWQRTDGGGWIAYVVSEDRGVRKYFKVECEAKEWCEATLAQFMASDEREVRG